MTDAPTPPDVGPTPLRLRRRAAATREILDAAQEQIALHGPAGLSLRSVARGLGMTVQALYHYFPSRDELVTALIAEAYHDLADAVQSALETTPRQDDPPRFIAGAEAFRSWGLDNPARFQLIYGTPLLHYEAPADGRTIAGPRRLAALLLEALFGTFTREQLARVDVPPLSPALREHFERLPPEAVGGLPPQAAALFVSAWGHLHGLVVLEVFGHTAFIGPLQAEIFRGAMHTLLADAHRRVPARSASDPNASVFHVSDITEPSG
ncbi:TetR/AcrR family transcriptional regulator [Sphaerisporangium sp. TRM90804]|uniref:TetR/AcrR family transcriptional regulator n=1 Tax=Sphaerisporangium sp. TRM90804 TaxID=3031113 RepID=UPI00244C7BEF|nr:TetR/AcrR family transcriptional regulator [Sphaerisporangium sp. TRM90804]MDH2425084.1 TetR/AcrR family transcriptional regulator [Sphaerisporangium sp. TRM90804]